MITETPAPTLNASHRCDACGAQAKAQANKPGSESLLLCGHHANKHGPALNERGWTVVRDTS